MSNFIFVTTEPPAGGLFGPRIDQAAEDAAVVTKFEQIEDAVERVVFLRANASAIRRAAIRQTEVERQQAAPRA